MILENNYDPLPSGILTLENIIEQGPGGVMTPDLVFAPTPAGSIGVTHDPCGFKPGLSTFDPNPGKTLIML